LAIPNQSEHPSMSAINEILQSPRLVDSGIAQRRRFDAGESIIKKGEEGRGIYLIESGNVRVSERVELEDRRHIQPGLCDLGAGDVFGELNLLDAAPRSATVTAVDECELLVLDAQRLVAYCDAHPEFGYPLLKSLFAILSDRLRQADRRLGSLFAWGLKAHGIDRHL
jgi:CRP-like cAMP-binding protein